MNNARKISDGTFEVTELLGKTIIEALIQPSELSPDQEFYIRCSDGSSFTLTAWKDEGSPICMEVEKFTEL